MTGIAGDYRPRTGAAEELRPQDPRAAGPYRLLGRLGSGGMGQVFLGRSPGGRLVAVKVVRAELAGQAGFRHRFAREVAAARTVSGLYTAAVVDADVDAPVPWLATVYVPGPSLDEAVASHGPLPATSVLALAAGLAEGLGAIHAAGIVHRDLKPSNVLLAEDGPRVIDFGISRAAEATMLTGTGVVFGSPSFMSPEQARGNRVGPPSDVFSLGAVLAFAATGEGPFGTGSSAALLYRVVFTPPDTSRLPAGLRPLVERCLAKDPEQRPTTGQLLADLGTAAPTTGWLPAPITWTFPSDLSSQPSPAASTAADDPPPVPTHQPVWVANAGVPESGVPESGAPESGKLTLPVTTVLRLAAAGTGAPRSRPGSLRLGLASAATAVTLLVIYLIVAVVAQLPPFGRASSAPSAPAPATTVSSAGPRSSPAASPATSPVTSPVTTPPASPATTPATSPATTPVTTPPASPATTPVTTPPTSPATSPAAASSPAISPASPVASQP